LQRRNNISYSLLGLELLYSSNLNEPVLAEQLLAAVINPITGFGRWKEVFDVVQNKSTDISKQLQLFIFFHQVYFFKNRGFFYKNFAT